MRAVPRGPRPVRRLLAWTVRLATLLAVAALAAVGDLAPAQAQAPGAGMTTITLASGLPANETTTGLDASTSFCVLGNSPSLTRAGAPVFSYRGPAMPPPASDCLSGTPPYPSHPYVAHFYSTILGGTQWVAPAANASDSLLPPTHGPVYYVYDAEFMVCPTATQAELRGARVTGSMLADNGARVYLNGHVRGTTPYLLSTQHNFMYATSFTGPPLPGLNVLDFVVEDASPAETGLDYSVTVTVPTCGQVKICKTAGNGVKVGTPFTFQVADPPGPPTAVTVLAGPAPGGFCAMAGAYVVNDLLTIHEAVPPGYMVTDIGVAPPARQVGVPSLATGTVSIRVGAGVTEVTYNDASRQTGFLEICKVAPPSATGVPGLYRFTVGTRTVVVPAGGCSAAIEVPAGTVVVSEPLGSGMAACSTIPPSSLVGCDLGTDTATVTVAPGDISSETILTVTDGPNGTTGSGSTGG